MRSGENGFLQNIDFDTYQVYLTINKEKALLIVKIEYVKIQIFL